jgi:hypothetical protein
MSIFIFYHFAGSFKENSYKREVISEIKQATEWVYVVESNTTTDKYKILTFDDRQDLSKGYLIEMRYNDINILFWILFTISIAIVVVGSFLDEANWDISDVKKLAIRKIITCELEDGKYHYLSLGRLLGVYDRRIVSDNLNYELRVYELDDVWRCPEFKTKKQNRNHKLDKLGV